MGPYFTPPQFCIKNKSNNLLDLNKSTNFDQKNLILKYLFMYCTIQMILWYNTIHTICTLYRTIYKDLWYIQYKKFYTWYVVRIIRYVWFYDTIRFIRYTHYIVRFISTYNIYNTKLFTHNMRYVSYNTNNYACTFIFSHANFG